MPEIHELRQRVEALLKAHHDAGSFLEEHPAPGSTPPSILPIAERPGQTIGRYKLLEEIAEGGMGVVYMAEQREPVRRKVALKIIKPGMDTREVIARFEAERQALAMMDHPNIAKVFDAGETESGRSYFVMELVHGIPLTDYCDQNELTTRERLELFVQVCQRGPARPSEGDHPSRPQTLQRDGHALRRRAGPQDHRLRHRQGHHGAAYGTVGVHQYGQMIGTPLYMSPEQAEMSGLDVDTRSDIYSLGMMLYELLTGSTPFDRSG